MNTIYEIIKLNNDNLDRVVLLRIDLVDICKGNINAALMLAQIIYWDELNKGKRKDWFYESETDWYKQIRLSEAKVRASRILLARLGFIEIKKKVAEGHNTYFYRLKESTIISALGNLYNERNKATSKIIDATLEITDDSVKITDATYKITDYTESSLDFTESPLEFKEISKSEISSSAEEASATLQEDIIFFGKENKFDSTLKVENLTLEENILSKEKVELPLAELSSIKESKAIPDEIKTPEEIQLEIDKLLEEPVDESDWLIEFSQPDNQEEIDFLAKFNLKDFGNPTTKDNYKQVKQYINLPKGVEIFSSLEDFIDRRYRKYIPEKVIEHEVA